MTAGRMPNGPPPAGVGPFAVVRGSVAQTKRFARSRSSAKSISTA